MHCFKQIVNQTHPNQIRYVYARAKAYITKTKKQRSQLKCHFGFPLPLLVRP